ncbi:MAG: type II toxin-antitoxin system VapC family toxin [Rhodocyclaceae bacterium]
MRIICDTHVLLFWADQRERLSQPALMALEAGRQAGTLACSDMSFCEMAMLFRKGRLRVPPPYTPASYMENIVAALQLAVLPISPIIAALAESGVVPHGDPGDRMIAATALHYNAPLITADGKLHAVAQLRCVW